MCVFLVMEVACGEHGNCVHHLVSAVTDGTCEDYYSKQLAITNGSQTNGTKASPTEPTELNHTPNGVAKPPGANAVINMPVSCTTSLLDSAESIEQKVGFPTNSFVQFWILLKRTFLSQMRDTVSNLSLGYGTIEIQKMILKWHFNLQTLTTLRFISHVIVGLLIGLIYYDIGNEASEVISNAGCVFFIVMFLLFTAMMPMILTCKLIINHSMLHWKFFFSCFIWTTVELILFRFSSSRHGGFCQGTLKLLVFTEGLLLSKNTDWFTIPGNWKKHYFNKINTN